MAAQLASIKPLPNEILDSAASHTAAGDEKFE